MPVVFALLCLALLIPAASAHAGPSPPVHECDRLAADPGDPQAVAPGVDSCSIKKSAIDACQEALRKYPDTPRFQHQLARTYTCAVYRNLDAVELFRKAADRGYAAAMYSLARHYRSGHGIIKDDTESLKWLRRAAVQGYPAAKRAIEALGETARAPAADSHRNGSGSSSTASSTRRPERTSSESATTEILEKLPDIEGLEPLR